jgi:response regulator RpfG family c-di-GMP phosphodiesterase
MIRATPGCRDIPAVALTGFASDVERQRFLNGGFQTVVVKPVLDHGELIAMIDRLAKFACAGGTLALHAPTAEECPRTSSGSPSPPLTDEQR